MDLTAHRRLALALPLALVATLTACAGDDGSTTGATDSDAGTSTATSTTTTSTTTSNASDASTSTAGSSATASDSTTTEATSVTTGTTDTTSSAGTTDTSTGGGVCGDGEQDPGEACDDGNQIDDDACSNACVLANCFDRAQNGGETDVDCGGTCSPCNAGQHCAADGDCASKICDAGACTSILDLPACADEVVDAATVHEQVIAPKCGASCHLGKSASAGLNLKDADALQANTVGAGATQSSLYRVEPGVPDESYFVYKILGQQAKAPGGAGSAMPIGASLTKAQKCLIINWVKSGAN